MSCLLFTSHKYLSYSWDFLEAPWLSMKIFSPLCLIFSPWGILCSWAWRKGWLNIAQCSWSAFSSGFLSLGIPPSRSLKRQKIALRKIMALVLLTTLLLCFIHTRPRALVSHEHNLTRLYVSKFRFKLSGFAKLIPLPLGSTTKLNIRKAEKDTQWPSCSFACVSLGSFYITSNLLHF